MNPPMLRHLVPLAGVCLLLAHQPCRAGQRASVRGMGMAFAHTAGARGIDAVGTNPANLALPVPGTVHLTLFPVSVHMGSEFLTYRLYTDSFTGVETDSGRVGRYLTDADKDDILTSFNDRAPHTRADGEGRLFGMALRFPALGAFAFTVTDAASVGADVPRDLAEFILYGNTPGSDFDFSSTGLRASWQREYALSFATAVPAFRSAAAGVTVKLVHGFGYYEISRFNARLTTDLNGMLYGSVDAASRSAGGLTFENGPELFPRPAGRGYGVDAGFTARLTGALTVGIALTDLGSIRWTASVRETVAETTLVVDEPLREDQRRAIENVLQGKTSEGGEFTTALPTRARVGLALDVHQLLPMPGELLVCVDYEQGLRSTPQSTVTPRGAVGLEFRPVHWLPLRTGLSVGGTDNVNLALGFGVDFDAFELAVASENATWVLQSGSFAYWSMAAGMTLRL